MSEATPFVLIVDDNKKNLEVLCVLFERNGFRSAGFHDEDEAVSAIEAGLEFDVVLCDRQLGSISNVTGEDDVVLQTSKRVRPEALRVAYSCAWVDSPHADMTYRKPIYTPHIAQIKRILETREAWGGDW